MARRSSYAGRGLGEKLSEGFIWIVILAGIYFAGRWYFILRPQSPDYALSAFLNAIRDGDPRRQYDMLSASTKKWYKDSDDYTSRFPLAQGLASRLANYSLDKVTTTGAKTEAQVTLTIRRTGQELYQASTDRYTDHYFLRQENSTWKVVLERCQLQSLQAVKPNR